MSLEQYNDMYSAAEPPEGLGEVPDGTYQVMCEACRVGLTKSQKDCLKWEFVVVSGPYQDRKIFKTSLFTDKAMGFLKRDLEVCGVVLDTFSDLPANLLTIIGGFYEIVVKTNGEYKNIYINKTIKRNKSDGEYNPPPPESDIPF